MRVCGEEVLCSEKRKSPLQEDKCDIKALIEFESVVKGERGDKLNALRFNILVEDV